MAPSLKHTPIPLMLSRALVFKPVPLTLGVVSEYPNVHSQVGGGHHAYNKV